jgi:TetR/AcrR family fatty acid metabolism transcriptional regulator
VRTENEPVGQRSFIEQARRAQIVASAIEVIAEVGYAGASLAAIARHAGISKGVISYHFAGKDELMETLVVDVYSDVAAAVVARMEAAATATEKIRTHVVSVAAYMREHRSALAALGQVFNNLREPDGKPRYGMHTSEELFQVLEQLYLMGIAAGEFRELDTRVMAVTHNSAIDAMFGYWAVHPEIDVDAYAHSLADLLVHAAARTTPQGDR